MSFIKSALSCRRMIPKEELLGEIPSSKEIYKRTFQMAWPAAVESVMVSLTNSIDTMMVGTLGHSAIAAVGITTQPKFLLLALILSLNIGVTTVVARRKGEGDMEGARRCLRQSIMLSLIFSLFLALTGYIFARPLLAFAGAGSDIIGDAMAYFRINMIGFMFLSLGLTINSAQRGAGNTKISMTTNLVANGINLVLNYLLIGGKFGFPALGVSGAAIATIIGQFVAFLLSCRSVLTNNSMLKINFFGWHFDAHTLKSLGKISSSALAEQLFMRFGFFSYAKIVAGLGTVAIATHQICMNIISLSFSFGDGFSSAVSALVGQSLGALRQDMAKIYVKTAKRLMTVVAICLCMFFVFGRFFVLGLFTKETEIIAKGSVIMLIIACTTLAQTSNLVYWGCLRGAGDARYLALISLLVIGILRPLMAYILCYPINLGLIGAWLSLFLDQCTRWLSTIFRFKSGRWTQIKV